MTVSVVTSIKKAWPSINKIKLLNKSGRSECRPEILILGLGNTILRDDGAGIYVARQIGSLVNPSRVAVTEASLGGLELLDIMAGFRKVIITDAMQLSAGEPGSIVKISADELKGSGAMARHQIPFAEALQLARQLNMDLPEEIIIYGIRVLDTTTFSETCTPEIQAAIPGIAALIYEEELQSEVLKQT